MRIWRLLGVTVVVAVICMNVGCASLWLTNDLAVGTWKSGDTTITFRADHTFEATEWPIDEYCMFPTAPEPEPPGGWPELSSVPVSFSGAWELNGGSQVLFAPDFVCSDRYPGSGANVDLSYRPGFGGAILRYDTTASDPDTSPYIEFQRVGKS